jgi:hypothetical protein
MKQPPELLGFFTNAEAEQLTNFFIGLLSLRAGSGAVGGLPITGSEIKSIVDPADKVTPNLVREYVKLAILVAGAGEDGAELPVFDQEDFLRS